MDSSALLPTMLTSLVAPDFFILRDDPPPATRKRTRPVTAQLIDELRRHLRGRQTRDHKFPSPTQDEQQQMADFALRILQIPQTEATAPDDLECDTATIRVAFTIYTASKNSINAPDPDRDLWDMLSRRDAAINRDTLQRASALISRFSTLPRMWYVITPEAIVNAFDVYTILYDYSSYDRGGVCWASDNGQTDKWTWKDPTSAGNHGSSSVHGAE